MTAPACIHYADGLHRWRYAVAPMTGTPYYGCGVGCPVVLPGDDVEDDAAYASSLGGEVTA